MKPELFEKDDLYALCAGLLLACVALLVLMAMHTIDRADLKAALERAEQYEHKAKRFDSLMLYAQHITPNTVGK